LGLEITLKPITVQSTYAARKKHKPPNLIPSNLLNLWHLASLLCRLSTNRTRAELIGQHGIVGGAGAPELPLFEDIANAHQHERYAYEGENGEEKLKEFHGKRIALKPCGSKDLISDI
jgi:hypothetical protein